MVAVLRLYLLAPAPTAAQRLARFPADEESDPIDPTTARRLAARVGSRGAVWRAPERRAEQTAAALGLAATPCDELRAWSAGAWSGQAVSSVAERDPERFRAWRLDPDAAPPGGESLRALIQRVAGWMEASLPASGRLLVVADAAVIRAAILHALDAGPGTFWRLDVPPLSLSVAQRAHDHWRLRGLGVEDGTT
jgi:broad specificity phosphatase PhoE